MKTLYLCAALGLGEGLAVLLPSAAPAWPAFAVAALVVGLFGYGFAFPGWRYPAMALLGAALFLHASLARETGFRERPWMRTARTWRAEDHEKACRWLDPVRRDLSRRVGIGLGHACGIVRLNRAILLGEREEIPRRLKRIFVDSGTIHVFAISGLHVMVVAKTLAVLLSLLFLPQRLAGAAALPLVWGYVLLIGAPPSAVRAALMATCYFAAPLCWRRPDAVRAWAIAFLVMHVFDPLLVENVGSQLSFIVMLAILASGRIGAAVFWGWRLKLWMTFFAWAAGVPVAAVAFARVTPGGVLANLVLIAAAGYSVMTGVLGLLMSFISVSLAGYFNNLSALFTSLMVEVAEGVSRLPLSNFEVPRWGILECSEWYAALAMMFWLARSVARRRERI